MSGWLKSQGLWREPSTNSSFRQRCASALTHPATVIALGILLVNDLLFKSLWPDAWVTGKLSDLAWMVFAPPLLAFLLSFLTRGNPCVEKASWISAYIGLPLLYAAFNTFGPVHDWILRGLSIASGRTSISPLDVTDSVVIPFGMTIAVWVWRQRVAGPAAQRLRWGLLVPGLQPSPAWRLARQSQTMASRKWVFQQKESSTPAVLGLAHTQAMTAADPGQRIRPQT